MSTFEKVFASAPNSEAAICEFLGKCKAFISLGNIVTGLFFYRRLS